jgi:hypothetical protein
MVHFLRYFSFSHWNFKHFKIYIYFFIRMRFLTYSVSSETKFTKLIYLNNASRRFWLLILSKEPPKLQVSPVHLCRMCRSCRRGHQDAWCDPIHSIHTCIFLHVHLLQSCKIYIDRPRSIVLYSVSRPWHSRFWRHGFLMLVLGAQPWKPSPCILR